MTDYAMDKVTTRSAEKPYLTSLSVIVPVFNGATTIEELTARLAITLPELAEEYELIFVEDSGSDNSWEIICQLVSKNSWVHGIQLMRNYGQHNALLCGIRAAHHEIIVTMDDDLQHPPEELSKLLAKLRNGFDVVYGTPRDKKHGFWRNLAARMTKAALESTVGFVNARNVSAFRAFRSNLRTGFAEYHSPYISIDVLLSWTTTRISAVQLNHEERRHGRSNYTFAKLVKQAINMMMGYSTLPLRLASLMGFAFTLFGTAVLVYVLLRYFIVGYSVPGFPFLASIVAIFSGVQLFALGVMGEYLARMYFRMMDRPTYAVRNEVQYISRKQS